MANSTMKIELEVSTVSGLLLRYNIRGFETEPGDALPLAVREFWERHLVEAARSAGKAYSLKVSEEVSK